MKPTYHLLVAEGPAEGARFDIAPRGCGLGRSSHNDIHVPDAQLSRLHCRFHYRGDDLWVTDLASANGTRVDGREVEESVLRAGSRIEAGDSVFRVEPGTAADAGAGAPGGSAPSVEDVGKPAPAGLPPVDPDGTRATARATAPAEVAEDLAAATSAGGDGGTDAIDLGLTAPEAVPAGIDSQRIRRIVLWSAAALVLLIAGGFALRHWLERPPPSPPLVPLERPAEDRRFELRYEKTDGSAENIFRYELVLDGRGHIAVSIDDLSQSRHVRRESDSPVSEDLLRQLSRQIEQAGFFGLEGLYEGVAIPNTWEHYDLTVVLGRSVHRVRVTNRSEPDIFRQVRERIETFVRNELGLWAVEFPSERLEQMAHDAFLLGNRLVQERDIQPGNLFAAIRSYREATNLLETVEPKPAFFGQALAALRDATEELERRYTEQNFRADRAIRLGDWQLAARELRAILALIPDRTDQRYRDAERRLLDVESRMDRRSR